MRECVCLCHLLETMMPLGVSCCNGNIVEQAKAHGLVGCGMMARRPCNGVTSRNLSCYGTVLRGFHHSIHQCQRSTRSLNTMRTSILDTRPQKAV